MYLSLRNTRFTEIRSCWFDPSMHCDCLQVWGRDHLIIGNRFVGALNMRVGAGNTEFPPFGGGYSRAEDCLIVGNRMDSGQIQVGDYWNSDTNPPVSLPANNNVLEANTRDAGGAAAQLLTTVHTLTAAQTNTTVNSTTAEPYTPAVKLTSANVGLNAPDPLCD
jgi:hypothetical protein